VTTTEVEILAKDLATTSPAHEHESDPGKRASTFEGNGDELVVAFVDRHAGSAKHVAPQSGHESSPMGEVIRARALSELVELHRVRAALLASREGHSQRELAKALGTSQSDVHRILRRARAVPDILSISPREMILEYLVGIISRGEMLGRLSTLSRGRVAPGNQQDGYSPDAWDEVRSAHLDGLIGDEVYEELRNSERTSTWRDSLT